MRNGSRVRWWGPTLIAIALLSGCGSDATSPLAPEGPRGSYGDNNDNWNGGGDSNGWSSGSGSGVAVFTVGRNGGTYSLAGGHLITFQRDAICDPLTSGYGPGTWDLPCQATRLPITITATSWTDADGHPRVDFEPDLRFTSMRDGGSRVLLQLRDKNGVNDPSASVFYCPTVGTCYDEAPSDVGVRSKRDPKRGWVYRYIKHFSGYNVTAGRAVEASAVEEIQ